MLEKSIKQLNRVSISVSLGLVLVLGLGLVSGLVLGLVLGLMPSSDIVLKSTVLSSSGVPKFLLIHACSTENRPKCYADAVTHFIRHRFAPFWFNHRRLKVPKRGMSSHATLITLCEVFFFVFKVPSGDSLRGAET